MFQKYYHLGILIVFIYFRFSFTGWAHNDVLSQDKEAVLDHFRLLGVVEALAAIFKVIFCYAQFTSFNHFIMLVDFLQYI